MKIRRPLPLAIILATLLVVVSGCASQFASSRGGAADGFEIILASSVDAVELECVRGCAWQTLTFGPGESSPPVRIDEQGMTASRGGEAAADAPAFLFMLDRSGGEISLDGVQGTRWKSLSYDCGDSACTQRIDQNGMTSR